MFLFQAIKMKNLTDRLLKKIGSSDIQKLSERNYFKDPERIWVHTGSPELEWNIGGFGFPIGITEVAGASKSGKTTLALTGMKWFQRQHPDGFCIILSSEERENDGYARKIGVDTENVIVIRSRFAEDLFFKLQNNLDAIQEIWDEDKMKGLPKIFVVWDSVGATNSRAELETFRNNAEIAKKNAEKGTKTEYKHAKMADFAKVAKMSTKAILAQLYEKRIIFVAINHLTDNLSSPTGGKHSTGGSWKEFFPTLKLRMERIKWIKLTNDGIDEEVAQTTRIKIDKNDFGSRRYTDIDILLGYGVILSQADIDYAVERKILKKEGAKKISYLGKLNWSTPRELYNHYYKNHPLLTVLHEKIMKERHKDIIALKEEDDE